MKPFEKINNKVSNSLREGTRAYILHAILLFVIAIIIVEIACNSVQHPKVEHAKLYELAMFFLIITGVVYFNLKVLVPRLLLQGRPLAYFLSILMSTLVVLILVVLTQMLLFHPTSDDKDADYLLLNIAGNILSVGLIIVSTSFYALFRRWAAHSQHIAELETATIQSELQQLKNQINPHFLFNTINNANIKVEKDPALAYHIITKLEDLLRYQLTGTSRDKVSLKDDIAFLSDYLQLEKTRRDRFYYTLTADERVNDLHVYPLLFIPFIENAVKHSQAPEGEAHLHIRFEKEKDGLRFHCENTKPTIPAKHHTGGIGLKNIQRRLKLLYGPGYTLKFTDTDNTYKVNLYIRI